MISRIVFLLFGIVLSVLGEDCPLARSVQLMHAVYNCDSIPIKMDGLDCKCTAIQGDQMAVCSGKLNYNADLYIAFSGTHNIPDFIADFKFEGSFVELVNMTVHNGFYGKFGEWKNSVDQVMTTVAKSSKIVLHGHSLGGAIARICSVYLKGLGYDVSVVSAGEPAAFKKPFTADLINVGTNSIRLVNFATYEGLCSIFSPNRYDPIPFISDHVGYEHDTLPVVNHRHEKTSCVHTSQAICSAAPVDISVYVPMPELHKSSPTYYEYTKCSQCNQYN